MEGSKYAFQVVAVRSVVAEKERENLDFSRRSAFVQSVAFAAVVGEINLDLRNVASSY